MSPAPLLAQALLVWRLTAAGVVPAEGADRPLPVGSLQKPWIAAAWAATHPDGEPPARFRCTPESRCWRPAGHGRVGLSRAVAVSCNAYFRELARATTPEALSDAFRDAGFLLPAPPTPEAAVGLSPGGPRITPRRLLEAYRTLIREPWPSRDDVRRAVLDGMADAAREGTGTPLSLRGLLVKTGTVPALDGTADATSGWALVADPDGSSLHLALASRGTGSETVRRLAGRLAPERPLAPSRRATPAPRREVRVRLFSALAPAGVVAINVGPGPARVRGRSSTRHLGPGARLELRPGDHLGEGTWELHLSPSGLVRRVAGKLEVEGAAGSPLAVVLETTPREWVEGVLLGELPGGSPERSEELAAVLLRFLRRGPRHRGADVCDTTHCAWFVGRGPAVSWSQPLVPVAAGGTLPRPRLTDAAWQRAGEASREEGPETFTGHCGGEPLSPHAVWGRGSTAITPCPRHLPGSDSAPWARLLPDADLAAVFGARVEGLSAVDRDGVRKTRVEAGGTVRELLYDELHARLARRLGWDALPSPPDSFERVPGGFRARGRGLGHRTGLCLAD